MLHRDIESPSINLDCKYVIRLFPRRGGDSRSSSSRLAESSLRKMCVQVYKSLNTNGLSIVCSGCRLNLLHKPSKIFHKQPRIVRYILVVKILPESWAPYRTALQLTHECFICNSCGARWVLSVMHRPTPHSPGTWLLPSGIYASAHLCELIRFRMINDYLSTFGIYKLG